VRLAARSCTRAKAEGFDLLAALARDAARFEHAEGLIWGLAREHTPEILVIARSVQGGRRPLDRFVGIPRYPWSMPYAVDLLLRGAGPIVNQEVVTCYGEVVRADLLGVVPTRFLQNAAPEGSTLDPFGWSDWSILRSHLSPRRAVEPVAPELFTWSSVFNSARDLWPGVEGLEQLAGLTAAQECEIADQFLGYGLEALAAESELPAVRSAARRLLELCDWGLLDFHLTCLPYQELGQLTQAQSDPHLLGRLLPEEHGLAYLQPSMVTSRPDQERRKRGLLLIPLQWIAAALDREIVALVHLVRVASFARDDSYGKLSGSVWGHASERHLGYEIPLFDVAVARADGLAARFLEEALQFDNRVYGLQIQRDSYCRSIERRPHHVAQYPEPSGQG
jgi:hypothetical protein